MDIASMSIVMANHQVRTDASLAMMNNVKDLMEKQGEQLVDMLKKSTTHTVPHPSLGANIDMKV